LLDAVKIPKQRVILTVCYAAGLRVSEAVRLKPAAIEVVGHYVSTDGSRFAALEPVSQAVIARFGGIEADAARGVTVRADNGPRYISRQIAH
jgi:integrase